MSIFYNTIFSSHDTFLPCWCWYYWCKYPPLAYWLELFTPAIPHTWINISVLLILDTIMNMLFFSVQKMQIKANNISSCNTFCYCIGSPIIVLLDVEHKNVRLTDRHLCIFIEVDWRDWLLKYTRRIYWCTLLLILLKIWWNLQLILLQHWWHYCSCI